MPPSCASSSFIRVLIMRCLASCNLPWNAADVTMTLGCQYLGWIGAWLGGRGRSYRKCVCPWSASVGGARGLMYLSAGDALHGFMMCMLMGVVEDVQSAWLQRIREFCPQRIFHGRHGLGHGRHGSHSSDGHVSQEHERVHVRCGAAGAAALGRTYRRAKAAGLARTAGRGSRQEMRSGRASWSSRVKSTRENCH